MVQTLADGFWMVAVRRKRRFAVTVSSLGRLPGMRCMTFTKRCLTRMPVTGALCPAMFHLSAMRTVRWLLIPGSVMLSRVRRRSARPTGMRIAASCSESVFAGCSKLRHRLVTQGSFLERGAAGCLEMIRHRRPRSSESCSKVNFLGALVRSFLR